MSDMQAQCWFMVCPDCHECVESMEIHCAGTMKGKNRMTSRDQLSELIRANRIAWATNAEHREMEYAQADAILAAGFGPVQAARAEALNYLVANSPRLPSEVRNIVFEAVFDVVDKFNFPAQNCGPRADVVEIGDVCGEVEKRIVAILRARAVAERGEG